ncbi:uncharacterized protein LOC133832391 [Humulus lupulus]|uniref:uncharacterized protein LOC133832391 n=1 Tax=Humulus lupulus TaxID=3486 RepID=UPI002B408101|nr:uncharacterized protein LOC133832391 [Humulus lupulus]
MLEVLIKREKQVSLSKFCFVNKIGLGALLETKLRGDKVGKMMSSYFIGWNYYSSSASEGRILIIWQPQVMSIEVLKESDQFVHICVKEVKSNKLFCVTFVYGRNSTEGRLPPWGTDRVGGRTISAIELEDAQKWRALGLVDELHSTGSHYTWTNKQDNENIIYSKLDRVVKNEDWLDFFPQAEVVFNWDLLYDHCYCIIKSGATVNCGFKPFIFFNMWIDHVSFKDTVLQSWNKPIKGAGLVRIVRKLSRLKVVLRKFNKNFVGDVAQNYSLAKDKFQSAQVSLQKYPHSKELQREELLAGESFAYHARAYDSFLRQKSKLIEKFDDVVAHFVTHFQKIMGSNSSASVPIQHSYFSFGHRLSLDQ